MRFIKKSEQIVYQWKFRSIIQKQIQRSDETIRTFDIIDNKSYWIALCLTNDKKVIIIERYIPWIERICYWLPWWMIEQGEQEIDCIKREILEETWYTSWQIIPLWRTPAGAYNNNFEYCFLALNCEINTQYIIDNEIINIHLLSIEELKSMLFDSWSTLFEHKWCCSLWLLYMIENQLI